MSTKRTTASSENNVALALGEIRTRVHSAALSAEPVSAILILSTHLTFRKGITPQEKRGRRARLRSKLLGEFQRELAAGVHLVGNPNPVVLPFEPTVRSARHLTTRSKYHQTVKAVVVKEVCRRLNTLWRAEVRKNRALFGVGGLSGASLDFLLASPIEFIAISVAMP